MASESPLLGVISGKESKPKYCTHNIAFAPLAAAVVHNMKITSFAYHWAEEIMEVIRLRPRPNVELFMRRTKL